MNNPGTFTFGDTIVPYLRSDITNAGNNQRSVEVPIALQYYNQAKERGKNILELGSVLPNYIPDWIGTWKKLEDMEPIQRVNYKFHPPHTCIDPTDQRIGIIHSPLDDVPITKRFDLIISLSSLVCLYDWNPDTLLEQNRIDYFRDLMRKLKKLVSPKGTILISLPWSYPNPFVDSGWVDKILNSLRHPEGAVKQDWEPTSYFKMNRVGFGVAGNQWIEKSDGFANLPYYTDVPSAGTIFFLIWNIQ